MKASDTRAARLVGAASASQARRAVFDRSARRTRAWKTTRVITPVVCAIARRLAQRKDNELKQLRL